MLVARAALITVAVTKEIEVPGAGLPRDSVVNVSQVVTVDKAFLAERAGFTGGRAMLAVENGLRTALAL